MKLLLDEMFPTTIAVQLRARGHDTIAVAERADLRELSDAAIFAVAQQTGRAVVTENIRDFVPLATQANGRDQPHYGLVLTTNRSLPRHNRSLVGRAVKRLKPICRDMPETPVGLVLWL